jgi:peptidyl-tRNA hydrolase
VRSAAFIDFVADAKSDGAAAESASNSSTVASAASGAAPDAKSTSHEDILVQYLVVRRDLQKAPHNWPLGALISNSCHAAVAVVSENWDDAAVQQYVPRKGQQSATQMHKVTLEVKSLQELMDVAKRLEKDGVVHKLWIEEPEKIPSCLASKPYKRSFIAPFFKGLKLMR